MMRIRSHVNNPGLGSFAVLGATLMTALGAWGAEHVGHGDVEWMRLLNPEHFFSFLGAMGSVLVAWLARSPIK